MNRLFYLSAVLLLITLNSCKKDGISYADDYVKSYRAWRDFQSRSGDSYVYQVIGGSWVGYNWETTITVKKGKAVERTYILKGALAGGPLTLMKEWKEEEAQLGTHAEGDPAITLNDIYMKAKGEWLKKRDDATTYFEAGNDGMISVCGYVPKNCADDCFRGIHIKFIREL